MSTEAPLFASVPEVAEPLSNVPFPAKKRSIFKTFCTSSLISWLTSLSWKFDLFCPFLLVFLLHSPLTRFFGVPYVVFYVI